MAGCQMIPFPKTENNDMPANILNLAAYNITGIQENEHDYHIDAETKQPPACCPHCNSSVLVGFGRREHMFRDMPMHGRRVGVYVNIRRMQCRTCAKTFSEPLRAKILFSEGAHKHKNSRPKFERKERPPVRVPNTRDFSMGRMVPGSDWELFAGFDVPKPPKPNQEPSTQPEKNYGADISTLIRLIESGEL